MTGRIGTYYVLLPFSETIQKEPTMRLRAPALRLIAIFLFAAPLKPFFALAQPVGFTGTPLLHAGISGDDTREAIIATAEFAPGGTTGRHTHPGDEYGSVVEGTLEFLVEGRAARRATAGEAFHNPKGVVHETRNVGSGTARVSSTFIIEKGQALVQPAQ